MQELNLAKGEGPTVPAVGPLIQTQSSNPNRSDEPLHSQGYPARLARVTQKLKERGFGLYPLTSDTWLVTQWGMSRTLPSIEAAERFCVMVGGGQ